MAKDLDGLLDYDFHPPEDLRLFTIPRSGVLRSDDEVVVYEVAYGETVLRHYAFRDHWFKVNCTFDGSGTLVEDDDTQNGPAFALNCDIATPMVRDGNAVFSTDLCIDVLIRADGIDHQVVDMAEFEVALRRGWISDREALGGKKRAASVARPY